MLLNLPIEYERAAPLVPSNQPLARQLQDRLAGGYAADPVAFRDLMLRRQGLTRTQRAIDDGTAQDIVNLSVQRPTSLATGEFPIDRPPPPRASRPPFPPGCAPA